MAAQRLSTRERRLVAWLFVALVLGGVVSLSGCAALRDLDAEARCDGRWRGFSHADMCAERIKREGKA